MCKALQNQYPCNPERSLSSEDGMARDKALAWEHVFLVLLVQDTLSQQQLSHPAVCPDVAQSPNSPFPLFFFDPFLDALSVP